MPKAHAPRSGSMQFWPRSRAKRSFARVRFWPQPQGKVQGVRMLGFGAYKAGMTHVLATDSNKNSPTRGEDIRIPVTIMECPPLRLAGCRFYKSSSRDSKAMTDLLFKSKKELARRVNLPKTFAEAADLDKVDRATVDDIVLLVHSQPDLARIKKRPEFFEIPLTGSFDEKVAFIKEHASKDLPVSLAFEEGILVDLHGITKGKGFQGPVKRFGIGLKKHKSEKGRRAPGSLGGWSGQGHVMYRVAHAGQMGFFQRTQMNCQILQIGDDPSLVTPKGDFLRYGPVRNMYVMMRGSVPGPSKRFLVFSHAGRAVGKPQLPTIQIIDRGSKQ
ncbi:MAG: 50S ribosomal protein L3 [Nanoarchaeota archaeon]